MSLVRWGLLLIICAGISAFGMVYARENGLNIDAFFAIATLTFWMSGLLCLSARVYVAFLPSGRWARSRKHYVIDTTSTYVARYSRGDKTTVLTLAIFFAFFGAFSLARATVHYPLFVCSSSMLCGAIGLVIYYHSRRVYFHAESIVSVSLLGTHEERYSDIVQVGNRLGALNIQFRNRRQLDIPRGLGERDIVLSYLRCHAKNLRDRTALTITDRN